MHVTFSLQDTLHDFVHEFEEHDRVCWASSDTCVNNCSLWSRVGIQGQCRCHVLVRSRLVHVPIPSRRFVVCALNLLEIYLQTESRMPFAIAFLATLSLLQTTLHSYLV
jgi:hypothetical protein